jgi:hypothetical protein
MSTQPDSSAIGLSSDVTYQPAWLTWVASTTTCLRALGVDCDLIDVAGFSGYAFHVGVHERLCPSGPTMLDWSMLNRGAHYLGRATTEFRSPCSDELGEARESACRTAFELARGELQAGRPCVLWGTYVPEFGVVVGIEGEAYRVRSFKEILKQEQPPIPYNETAPPGGVYLLAFPARADYNELHRDLESILEALRQWERKPYGLYRFGRDAYDLWIDTLKANRGERFGCGFNAACYTEGRRFAGQFFERMSTRRPLASGLLRQASESYADAAAAMGRVSEIFPFDAEDHSLITDAARIEEAAEHLAEARDAEAKAMQFLKEITKIQARPPGAESPDS